MCVCVCVCVCGSAEISFISYTGHHKDAPSFIAQQADFIKPFPLPFLVEEDCFVELPSR